MLHLTAVTPSCERCLRFESPIPLTSLQTRNLGVELVVYVHAGTLLTRTCAFPDPRLSRLAHLCKHRGACSKGLRSSHSLQTSDIYGKSEHVYLTVAQASSDCPTSLLVSGTHTHKQAGAARNLARFIGASLEPRAAIHPTNSASRRHCYYSPVLSADLAPS